MNSHFSLLPPSPPALSFSASQRLLVYLTSTILASCPPQPLLSLSPPPTNTIAKPINNKKRQD